jgi:hypothetical protein
MSSVLVLCRLQHSSLTEITTVLVRVDNEERYLLQKVACKKTNLIAAYTALVKELASEEGVTS